jgi:hypothetical protein
VYFIVISRLYLCIHVIFKIIWINSLDKIMVRPDGLKTVKGVHSLGQEVEKNDIFGLYCCWRVNFCINLFLFFEHCNVNLYMFSAW